MKLQLTNNRFYAFFGGHRAAVAMDVQGVNITFALAFCNKKDSFRKQVARDILNGRLNAKLDPEHQKPVKHTFSTVYNGTHPKRDVMCRVMDELRAIPENREHDAVQCAVNNINEDLLSLAVGQLHPVS